MSRASHTSLLYHLMLAYFILCWGLLFSLVPRLWGLPTSELQHHTHIAFIFFTHRRTPSDIYRLTPHTKKSIVISSRKETLIFIYSQIHVRAPSLPSFMPRYMHSCSHTLTSKHRFTLTARHIYTYQCAFTHWLLNTQIHICPPAPPKYTYPGAHMLTHTQSQNKSN